MIALPQSPESANVRALASFTRERFTGGTNATLALQNAVVTGTEQVIKNGLVLDFSGGYTVSGATVTLASAPVTSDVIVVRYFYRSAR